MVDLNAQAAYRRMLARAGQLVTFTRNQGSAPNITPFSVTVMARVTDYIPDTSEVGRTGFSASRMGAITQGDRKIIVLAADLGAARFPLPLAKNDKVTIAGEQLNITSVDPNTRGLAGAIEVVATGV